MNQRRTFSRLACCLCLASLAGACTEKREYQMSVVNHTSQPLTLWLTKDGSPGEAGWEPPEQLAAEHSPTDDLKTQVIVKPGQTASAGPITGSFARRTRAVLRIYLGEPSFAEILGISTDSLDRRDVPLQPGRNKIVVDSSDGPLTVVRVQSGPTEK